MAQLMDNNLMTLLLADAQLFKHPPIIRRDLPVSISEKKVSVLTGMRRTGKTSLAWQLMQDFSSVGIKPAEMLYLNFEDDRMPHGFNAGDLGRLIDYYGTLNPGVFDATLHLFLDEIQEVIGWEKTLRRFLDTRRVKICITGSSSRMLSADIATALRGRALTF